MQVVTDAVASWTGTRPQVSGEFQRDADTHFAFWRAGHALLEALPEKPKRNPDPARAAETILRAGRESREAFMLRHAQAVYGALTKDQTKFVRADVLAYEAAALVPGLTPTRQQVYAQGEKMQRDKDGIEVDQGIFFAHILARPDTGAHFCHAMLLPRVEALARLDEFTVRGAVDLGTASVMRQGKAATVAHAQSALSQCGGRGDAAADGDLRRSRDPRSQERAMRAARRYGRQSEIRRPTRVLDRHQSDPHLQRQDFVHVVRHARDGLREQDDARARAARRAARRNYGGTTEKPWIAGVEHFAIGGGCQYLLTMDYVVAASDAYMTLPARKEGIIPGAANMRMPRFTGDRIARQAIMSGRRLDCDTPEGPHDLRRDRAAGRDGCGARARGRGLDGSGVVSAAGNRRAFRVAQEPLDSSAATWRCTRASRPTATSPRR